VAVVKFSLIKTAKKLGNSKGLNHSKRVITCFNSIIFFRIVLVIGIVILSNSNVYSQSKKEQIQILNTTLDSLKTVQYTEKQNFETRKNELESSLSNSDQKTDELLKTLSTKKEKLNNQILENQKLDQDVLSLQIELKSMQDSIKTAIKNQPIKLLGRIDDKKNDEELIQLFNLSLSDVPETDRCSQYAKFIIVGKQDYINGLDTFSCIVLGAECEENYYYNAGSNYIGLFKFSKNEYTKIFKPIYLGAGGYGNGRCAPIEAFKIMGRKNLCVILNSGYGGHGVFEENRSLYLINTSTIQAILTIQKHNVDQGNRDSNLGFENSDRDWDIKFIDNNSDYFNLEIIEKSHGKKVKTRILKFNENSMKYE
jgi:hypothetical protein